MPKVNVLKPEIDLIKADEFYLFYEMMMQSLRTDNVKEGINKSLYMLRTFLNSGNIVMYKKNEDGTYVYRISDSEMGDLIQSVSCIVNKTRPLIEQKEIFNLELSLGRLDNMMLLHIPLFESDCVLAIINNDNSKELEPQFWRRVIDTMQIILKRAASYERNTKAATIDLLTDLDNRNSYEMRMQTINEDEDLVLGIFDLFRLKYVNDNYTHAKGDVYIKEVAKILNKYWPKQSKTINADSTENFVGTGHCLYRYGGDEFVLLTTVEDEQLANIKARLAQDEANMINLDVDEDLALGLNYGIVKHNPGDKMKYTFSRADEIMEEDKKKMYKKYNLERRR